jgi:hypothetical protein
VQGQVVVVLVYVVLDLQKTPLNLVPMVAMVVLVDMFSLKVTVP